MFKKSGYAALGIAFLVALSGVMFINRYDISGSSTNVIEAALMHVTQLRYLIASIFVLVATVCFATDTITRCLRDASKAPSSTDIVA
ncbi:MAG: hypothetical protein FIB06_05545 [Betaproteobacteria bacterium]|nr:hypothetical protein [Betaproteobacteria bacterium]